MLLNTDLHRQVGGLRKGGYVFVCLSVCPLDYSKRYNQILMKFLEAWPKDQLIRFCEF